MESILKPTLVLMAGRGLAFAGTFFIPLVLARVFDPAGFGTYKQLLLVFATLYGLAPLGMAESLYYFLPREPRRAGRFVANALLFLGAAGLLVVAALVAGAPRLAASLSNPAAAAHLPALAAFTALMLAAAPLETAMIARQRYRSAAASYALSDLGRAALFTLPALLAGSLAGLLAGAIVFAALRLGLAVAWLAREFGGELRPDLRALGLQLGYALPFGAAALVEVAQGSYHQFAVSHRFGAAAFALYSVGCLQIPFVDLVAAPAGNVAMVRMAELRDDRAAVLRLWHATTRQLAAVFVPLVVLLELVAGELIVALFTPVYAPAASIFRLWCLTILLSTLQTDAVLRVHARTRLILGLNLLRLGLVAGTLGAALQAFGLAGAALAAVAAAAAAKALALLRLRALFGVGQRDLLPWGSLARCLGAALLAALPAGLLLAELAAPPLVRLLAAGLVYASAYAALAPALVLTDDERRALLRGLARPWQALAQRPAGS